MMSFHLKTDMENNVPYINKWIEFAMSRKAENISLDFSFQSEYKIADSFYIYSSVKELSLQSYFVHMMPKWVVSWTSLKKLSMRCCCLQSIANILSGCPVLECLILNQCKNISYVLDVSKALRLRTLEIKRYSASIGPRHIVAPQIHCLRMINSEMPCTLVDVSSLTEAKMDISFVPVKWNFEKVFPRVINLVVEMLEKLQNVENLTFGGNYLQILSLAEVCGVPFPMLKAKTLTLETVIFRYVIPGIERLLQNSPELKKLTIRAWDCNTISEEYLDKYLTLQGLNPDQCWRSKDGVIWNRCRRNVESKHITSFVKLLLKNTKTLDKMVVQLDERYLKYKVKKLRFQHLLTTTMSPLC